MKRLLLVPSFALAMLAGCSCSPEVIACPPAPYTTDDLEECGCAPPVESGLLTAVMAGPGSFDPEMPVTVLLRGRRVASGTSALDGSLALLVTVPGAALAAGADLEVVVNRSHVIVHVPADQTAFVITADDFTFTEDPAGLLQIDATARAISWTNCGAVTPTSPPVHVYAANLTEGVAAVGPAPTLDVPFQVSVAGHNGDIAVMAVGHENGGVSGCFLAADVCCDCEGVGGGHRSPFRRSRCSERLRAEHMCRPTVTFPDAGADGGGDAAPDPADGGNDAGTDADVDAARMDSGPPD